MAAIRKFKPSKYINKKELALIFTAASVLFVSNACSPSDPNTSLVDVNPTAIKQQQQKAAEIEDNIKNSYARLAAQHADICPKLLQGSIGEATIERASEVMVNDHCDYFLYLRRGQKLAVTLDNRQIEALLIVPTLHNFANGDYEVVSSYDKHVIRLAYDGATYKPKHLSYDVAIKVTD